MEKLQKLRSIKKAFQISETLFIYLICLVLNFLYAMESIRTENVSAKTGIKIYGSIKLPKTLYINDEEIKYYSLDIDPDIAHSYGEKYKYFM